MGTRFWNRLSHECELWQKGLSRVAGVDEAGCGPLAGPVVAAAVIFPRDWLESGLPSQFRGLNDSKQLDEEAREKFFRKITTHPGIHFAIASMDAEMIDRINIRQAAWRAMNAALDQITPRAEHVLVDGLAHPVAAHAADPAREGRRAELHHRRRQHPRQSHA